MGAAPKSTHLLIQPSNLPLIINGVKFDHEPVVLPLLMSIEFWFSSLASDPSFTPPSCTGGNFLNPGLTMCEIKKIR